MNLQGANRVVIFDPSWNPTDDMQAEDRAYRWGQRRDVTVYRLLTTGTIEERVYMRQIYKKQLTDEVQRCELRDRHFDEKDIAGIEALLSFDSDPIGAMETVLDNHQQELLKSRGFVELIDTTATFATKSGTEGNMNVDDEDGGYDPGADADDFMKVSKSEVDRTARGKDKLRQNRDAGGIIARGSGPSERCRTPLDYGSDPSPSEQAVPSVPGSSAALDTRGQEPPVTVIGGQTPPAEAYKQLEALAKWMIKIGEWKPETTLASGVRPDMAAFGSLILKMDADEYPRLLHAFYEAYPRLSP